MKAKKKVEEKKQRNESIRRAINAGSSTREVGKRYGISNKRAWDIAQREKKFTIPKGKRKKKK